MDWEKTTIKLRFNNGKYKNGFIVRTFNNITQEPTEEQLQTFIDALLLLSDGDTFSAATITSREKYIG